MAREDAHFQPFAGARVGEPLLVHTLAREPAHWTVPVEEAGRAIGFVRVDRQGRAVAAGAHYSHPERRDRCPPSVTEMTTAEAERRALEATGTDAAVRGRPLLVYEGSPGRECWLVEVTAPDRPPARLLVTPSDVRSAPKEPSEPR